ncbi:hypothetical protein EFW58_01055 [Bacillus velezensis]|nr:hypothetical protein EFW58_01055 [Bacillus velezensis]
MLHFSIKALKANYKRAAFRLIREALSFYFYACQSYWNKFAGRSVLIRRPAHLQPFL